MLRLLIISIVFIGMAGCKKESNHVKFHLDSIARDKYYSAEIIPGDHHSIYGKWKLFKVSGGFSGAGHDPDFDYLEIKSVGIYGLVRNDILFEYGKIALDTFDISVTGFLQVKFIPDYHKDINPYFYLAEKYVDLKRTDTLDLISPCCDMYNYHFKRIQ